MNLKSCWALTLLALFTCLEINADSIDVFVDRVNRFNKVFPQEKVYLHIDNTGYYMEEDLWYKAYVFSTNSDSLGAQSGVLHVELLDPYGEVVKSQKSKIVNGEATGHIQLTKLLRSGFYELRAYTRYMLNWGDDAVFSRVIPIFEGDTIQGKLTPTIVDERLREIPDKRDDDGIDKQWNIHFYPEGGHAVNGLPVRTAFSLRDREGNAVSGKYALTGGEMKDTLTEGRGIVTYTPSAANQHLEVTTSEGKKLDFELPQGEASGCVLTVDALQDNVINVDMKCSADLRGKEVGVVWLHNGRIYDCKRASLGGEGLSFDRNTRQEGVNQLTVIDQNGHILASRMVFIYPKTKPDEVVLAKTEVKGNDSIDVRLTAQPGTSLSVSVVDVEQQTSDYLQNAATWWLLTSDLKGYIAHPETYLESDDAEHRRAADLLMMVQGWKRYNVKMMEGKETFVMRQPTERQLIIDGKLYPAGRNKKVGDVTLYLLLKNALGSQLEGVNKTDSAGRYCFLVPDCIGEWDMLVLTGKDNKLKNYYVGFNRQFSPEPRYIGKEETEEIPVRDAQFRLNGTVSDSDSTKFEDGSIWIETVTKTADRNRHTSAYWARESLGAEGADIVYDCRKELDKLLSQGKDIPSLIDFLRYKNPNINGNDNLSGVCGYLVPRPTRGIYFDGPAYNHSAMLWYVDNYFIAATSMPMSGVATESPSGLDKKHLSVFDRVLGTPLYDESDYDVGLGARDETPMTFPTSLDEVKRVYITFRKGLLPRSFRRLDDAWQRNFVIVNVYTSPNAGLKRQKGVHYSFFDGFNSPDTYDEMETSLLRPGRDFRRTLYWNPSMKVGADGILDFSFKNNNEGKEFRISAEGFTPDGHPAVLK